MCCSGISQLEEFCQLLKDRGVDLDRHPTLEQLNRYCDGYVTEGEIEIIEAHLTNCSECSYTVSQVVRSSYLKAAKSAGGE
jgi:hypothetical protein